MKAKAKRRDQWSDTYPLSAEEWTERPAGFEQAYRRGYLQGFFAAMDAADHSADTKAIEDFLYGALYRWRYNANMKAELPPVFWIGKKPQKMPIS